MLDKHPKFSNVVVGAGFSGECFLCKHAHNIKESFPCIISVPFFKGLICK